MKISSEGLNLIKKWEGFYADAYLCPANVWTIGYGTTVYPNKTKVKKGDKIKQSEALELLEKQVNEHASTIFKYVKVELTQFQFDALASFQYNLGSNILKDSTLLKYINSSNWEQACLQILLYNKAGGKVFTGLVNRRKDEVALFMKAPVSTSKAVEQKGVEDDMKFSSTTLKNKYNTRMKSDSDKNLIVKSAVEKLGYDKSWLTKKDIAEGDYISMGIELSLYYISGKK